MSTETQELPEIGEIVIATITKVSDHGAYATLDEYNGIQGFLHVYKKKEIFLQNKLKVLRIKFYQNTILFMMQL